MTTTEASAMTLTTLKEAAAARGWDYTTLRSAAHTADLATIRGGRDVLVTEQMLDEWAARVAERGGEIRAAKGA